MGTEGTSIASEVRAAIQVSPRARVAARGTIGPPGLRQVAGFKGACRFPFRQQRGEVNQIVRGLARFQMDKELDGGQR